MARPRKSPVAAIDEAFAISSEPFDGEVVETAEEDTEVVSERNEKIEALTKLFPRAPLEEYDDALLEALYKQHVGVTVRPE